MFVIFLAICSRNFQDQNEGGSEEIEELKQAVLESHRNLLAIRAAFESENEATKERLQILEDNLDETRMELLRTKMELAESRSQLTRNIFYSLTLPLDSREMRKIE